MFGRVLLDNDDWLVTLGLLGSLRVTLKWREITRKARPIEKKYFSELIAILSANGVPIEPGNATLEQAIIDFADAMFGGDAHWRSYFDHPPSETAQDYL